MLFFYETKNEIRYIYKNKKLVTVINNYINIIIIVFTI